MSRESAITLILVGLFSIIGAIVMMAVIGKLGMGFETVLLCGGAGVLFGGMIGTSAATAREDEQARAAAVKPEPTVQ